MTLRFLLALASVSMVALAAESKRSTAVTIDGAKFLINGQPTYKGRTWNGHSIEGLLFNSRMVQATFDDRNPKTVALWAYPDTKKWDPDRNTNEFLAEMPGWRKHGLLAVTLNLQGGSPQGYSRDQPWHNSALISDGSLDPKYLARLARVIAKADELGMVVILGIYYFGQDERLKDEAAVLAGVDATIDWVVAKKYSNVLIEINNECNVRYHHAILKPDRVHELIRRAKERSGASKFPLLVGTSYAIIRVPITERRQGVRLPSAARQGGQRPGAHRRDGPRGEEGRGLPAHADPVQRGRSLRVRQAGEQLRGRGRRVRLVGLL